MQRQNPIPPLADLEEELKRLQHKQQYGRTLRGTIYILIVVAAVSVLAATILLPVLHLSGSSMDPVLKDGELVLALKNSDMQSGDIIAFYYNNKILVKRVIGLPGDIINIEDDGTVILNGSRLDEQYITDKDRGDIDIDMPYQVTENRVFVMGDHRSTSIDSRSKAIGTIEEEQIVGKIVFRFWPFERWGTVSS